MNFAKCLELNRSIRPMSRMSSEFELPRNERAPIYRRQVGPVFSVEYSGEPRLNYSDRVRDVRPGLHGCLFWWNPQVGDAGGVRMHRPVMLNEVLEALKVGPGERVVDATLGGAGHAEAIMERIGEGWALLGLDRDAEALKRASERLALMPGRSIFRKASFADLRQVAEGCGLHKVNAILMDLGISSIQLDDAERGFSFQRAGPLDMRMDRDAEMTAWNIVNEFSEMELANLLHNFGEERQSRRIAHAIVAERSRGAIDDTVQLAEIVERAKGGRRGRCHPATQTFMALRIAVNDELEILKEGLRQGLELLAVGGRVAVLSFHSLEDRIVKSFFKSHAGREESLQAGGSRWVGEEPPVEVVTKKPVTAGEEESKMNPRARSAKLRVAERCG